MIQSPTLGTHTHAHGFWVGMGAVFNGNIIGNVTIFKYIGNLNSMGGHGWPHVMLWVGMGGHRSMSMGVVWVWVQIRRKCWALLWSPGFVLGLPPRGGF